MKTPVVFIFKKDRAPFRRFLAARFQNKVRSQSKSARERGRGRGGGEGEREREREKERERARKGSGEKRAREREEYRACGDGAREAREIRCMPDTHLLVCEWGGSSARRKR